jgi:putative membrane protein
MQQFLATGLHASADRTGVVIFASEADRRVELLADDAIHAAVGDVAWNAAVKAVQDGMRRRDPAAGFVKAIQICGDALAEHFPSTGPHVNTLSDRLLEL